MWRIGTVPWLNAAPLVAGLEERARLSAALPGELSEALARGDLDAALLPVAEAARGVGAAWVGRHGIASEGPVASVLLFLRRPLPEVLTLVLDPASRTSAALARHLVAHATQGRARARLAPRPGPDPAATEGDAVLVIGDPARRALASWRGASLDLGAAWTERTGLPFVFARWRCREGLAAAEREALSRLLDEAADRGLPERAALAREFARRHGQDEAGAVEYVRRHVRYRIGPREEEALERFLAIVRTDDAAAPGEGAATPPDGR